MKEPDHIVGKLLQLGGYRALQKLGLVGDGWQTSLEICSKSFSLLSAAPSARATECGVLIGLAALGFRVSFERRQI